MKFSRYKICIPSIDIDVFKGGLIFLVIIGHCHKVFPTGIVQVIYWFHMPCFFMLSGWVSIFPPSNGYKEWVVKKVKRLLIPQFVWFFILTSIQGRLNLTLLSVFLKGARNLGGVYWYIPVLFFDLILFEIIRNMCSGSLIKMDVVFILIYFLVIFFQYWVWIRISLKEVTFSLGVSLLCLVYMYMGYRLRLWHEEKSRLSIIVIVCAICLLIFTIILYKLGIYKYNMNLAGMEIGFAGLNLLIPFSFMICMIFAMNILFSVERRKSVDWILKCIRKLGKNSLLVMYLHKYILNDILEPLFWDSNFMWMINVLLTIIVVHFFLLILSKIPCSMRRMLGGE